MRWFLNWLSLSISRILSAAALPETLYLAVGECRYTGAAEARAFLSLGKIMSDANLGLLTIINEMNVSLFKNKNFVA